MIGINGFPGRPLFSLGFVFVDSLLVFLGVLTGIYFRLGGVLSYLLQREQPVLRIMVIVVVAQIAFYYFDLYNVRIFRERKATAFLLFESLGVSAILLALAYYLFPFLLIGRGVLAFSLSIIYLLAFFWRAFYVWASGTYTFKEKILIIGTGELARKIKQEILENGNGSFEIVGFIDESASRVGKSI